MADEVFTASEDQELFQLSNGRYIMDEDQSRKMFYIKEAQPERSHQASGTGSPRTPAALREGVWGRRFSQRSGLPQRPPKSVSKRREREGGDFSTEKSSPSQSHTTY